MQVNSKMTIYLDTCSLQRPLDDKLQLRIRVEAEAILGIIYYFETGEIELFSSDVLFYETERNADEIRRQVAMEILKKARKHIVLSDEIVKMSKTYIKSGLKALDALHLASAIYAETDYFCTCDDKFFKKAKELTKQAKTKMVTPTELILEVEDESGN